MCKTKDEASTKLDKLIATMERLAVAVEASNAQTASARSSAIVDVATRRS